MPDPILLPRSLAAWHTGDFRAALCRELEALGPHRLPLQQGLVRSSHVSDAPIRVMALGEAESGPTLTARVGVFYAGVIAGCNCADDPTPVDAQSEYCVLQVVIDRTTGAARVSVADD